MADLKEEKKLWRKGYKRVVGLDESGRGPLAGPVVAAATTVAVETRELPPSAKLKNKNLKNILKEIKDSKKLSAKKREKFYKVLISHPVIEWGIGKVGPKVIDKINIFQATKLAMKRAIKNLEKKLLSKTSHKFHDREKCTTVDFLILDGNFKLDLPTAQKSIIKADQKVFSCIAASIISKVTRDRIMKRYHKKYPQYGFDKHKGYPTKLHLRMLKRYGPCKIHRMSFKPVKINKSGAQPKAGRVGGGWSPTKLHKKMLKKYGPSEIHRKTFLPVRACKLR